MRIAPLLCLCFVCFVFLISSCSYKQSQVLFQQKNTIPDSVLRHVANPSADDEYKIRPQDLLQIRNLQGTKYLVEESVPNLATGAGNATGQTFQVNRDGIVKLPVLGDVAVAGLTRPEASKLIENLYRKTLLKDPIIELKVVNMKVTLLGESKAQGNFLLTKEKTTLIEILGEAGGLSEKADEKHIKIIRGTQNNLNVTMIDLSDINILNDPRIYLQNNDIIYIAQNKRAIRNNEQQNFFTTIQPALILFTTVLAVYTFIHR